MDRGEVTELLREVRDGRPGAMDRLIPVVYGELKRIATAQLRREDPGHTLGTTALVHEAYLKLAGIDRLDWQDRAHFFAVATRQMRRVLVDHARARGRAKRGGGAVHVTLDDVNGAVAAEPADVLALDDALTRLEARAERPCRVVEYRCIAGMSVEETAEVLDVSPRTVKRDWAFARAWLNRELTAAARTNAGDDGSDADGSG